MQQTELIGSEKQVGWANQIRTGFLAWWDKPETQDYLKSEQSASYNDMLRVVPDLLAEVSASVWIRHGANKPPFALMKSYAIENKTRYREAQQ